MRNAIIVILTGAVLWGCEEEKKPAAEEKPVPAAVAPAAVTASPEPIASAANLAKAAANEAQKAVEENPLTPCCRELGRIGFMERSAEYTAASQDCGKGMEAKKGLAEVAGDLKKALKGKALPDQCVAK